VYTSKVIKIRLQSLYQQSRQLAFGRVTWLYAVLALVVVTAGTAGFAELADEMREQETLPYDEAVLNWFHGFQSVQLDIVVKRITDMGDVVGISLLCVGLLALLWYLKKRAAMVQLGLGVLGAVAINLILKSLFMRDRPALWEHFVTETSYSFPSGHAMASSALAFSAMVIFWHTKFRWWAVGIGLLYMVVIGCTRLYLGVHYPTDILAGWCVSAVWVVIVAVLTGAVTVKPKVA
jgi:membrane-associated phospholipid phosphatase